MSTNVDMNVRPDYDQVIQDFADYVIDYEIESVEAMDTARNCLMDTLGCGLLALRFPECTKHLGPLVPGTVAQSMAPHAELDDHEPYDSSDWWYRCTFDAPEGSTKHGTFLHLEGLATLAQVWLNGVLVLESTTLFFV